MLLLGNKLSFPPEAGEVLVDICGNELNQYNKATSGKLPKEEGDGNSTQPCFPSLPTESMQQDQRTKRVRVTSLLP